MNQSIVLEHRIKTLDSLLDTPGGPLGPNAGPIGDRLRDDWNTERRLLLRLIDESEGEDVRETIAGWRDRTLAFIARSETSPATWTDRDGVMWHADSVLVLLSETDERIERWLRASAPEDGDEPKSHATDESAGAPSLPASGSADAAVDNLTSPQEQ